MSYDWDTLISTLALNLDIPGMSLHPFELVFAL